MYLLFASRRRHTRWPRDWSSDVCSSDLCHYLKKETIPEIETLLAKVKKEYARVLKIHGIQYPWLKEAAPRSEERRVGKECRARLTVWGTDKKNKSNRLSVV